jgi:putative heme iron utilization protein
MDKSKRLTIRCSAELHRRIKVQCVNDDVEMNAALLAILEREYAARSRKAKPASHREEAAA